MKTFDNTKYKIPQLLSDVTANESTIDFLKLSKIKNTATNNFENYNVSTLVHVPVLYDLYNFRGTTYTNDPAGAIPPECYDFDGTAYIFNLPIWGFRVAKDVDPEVLTGASPWLFLTTVNFIHTRINYLNLPDSYIKKAKVVSYLYTDDNTPIPSLNILIDQYNDLYTDFSYFYRWLKVDDGYILDFYSFFPYFPTVEVKLKTNVYFLNKDLGNENQSNIF
jgi:hypothetical protein